MVGRTLQRYRLMEEVGHGGMAVVYRGLDEGLERDVAVKLLHPHLAAKVDHRRRLAREARAVARLRHPNILEIFDFSGEESPEAFIVTELIRGPTLRTFAQEHAFDPPELAGACVHALAGALAHAHAAGIVHRDLKPDNVMIQLAGPQPAIKLMDFGIAQILDRDERMTMTGSLMGSPAHMAPEIINGEEADERSDIYSLGTILYWLVTGQLPFEAASPGALLKRVLEGDLTDPRVLRPAVSDRLAKVITDSLARERANRIPSATAFQARLADALADVGLNRPDELLTAFLASPVETARLTRTTIVAKLMEQGKASAELRKTGKALAAYSRVMAIVPGTPDAGAARQAIDRLNSRRRWRRRGLTGLGAALVTSLFFVWRPLSAWVLPPRAGPVVTPVELADLSPAAAPHVDPPASPAPVEHAPAARRTTDVAMAPAVTSPRTPPRPVDLAHPAPADGSPGTHTHSIPPLVPATATHTPSLPLPTADLTIITGSGPSGNVFIDGKQMQVGTPFTGSVTVGRHEVELTRPECCESIKKIIDVKAGEKNELRARLAPKPAQLKFFVPDQSEPGLAETAILVDGAIAETLKEAVDKPLLVPFLPDADGHQGYVRDVVILLQRVGYRDQRIPLHLDAGKSQDVHVKKMVPSG